MREGVKPLSMFSEALPLGGKFFPEDEFDCLVAAGKLKKKVVTKTTSHSGGIDLTVRRILYALPGEEWRILAMCLVQDIYDDLGGWRLDLDRVIGSLLGYDPADVEHFIAERSRKMSKDES
jgi:hypothetical protein